MYSLKLYHDHFESNAVTTKDLNAQHSICFVREGEIEFNGKKVESFNAMYTQEPTSMKAISNGAIVWRWELERTDAPPTLVKGDGVKSKLKMARRITMFELFPKSRYLFKLDSIIKHKGSTGLHSHPGSGIRCMIDGQFDIVSTLGESFYDLKNGDAWYEEGAYPLVSTSPDGVETTFLRGMILPPEFDTYPDTAFWIEGTKPCESDWKLYSQQLVTLL